MAEWAGVPRLWIGWACAPDAVRPMSAAAGSRRGRTPKIRCKSPSFRRGGHRPVSASASALAARRRTSPRTPSPGASRCWPRPSPPCARAAWSSRARRRRTGADGNPGGRGEVSTAATARPQHRADRPAGCRRRSVRGPSSLPAWRAAADGPARGRASPALAAECGLLDHFADAVAGATHGASGNSMPLAAHPASGSPLRRRRGRGRVDPRPVLLADLLNFFTASTSPRGSQLHRPLAASALAGLSALSGLLHGGMAARVEALVAGGDARWRRARFAPAQAGLRILALAIRSIPPAIRGPAL